MCCNLNLSKSLNSFYLTCLVTVLAPTRSNLIFGSQKLRKKKRAYFTCRGEPTWAEGPWPPKPQKFLPILFIKKKKRFNHNFFFFFFSFAPLFIYLFFNLASHIHKAGYTTVYMDLLVFVCMKRMQDTIGLV